MAQIAKQYQCAQSPGGTTLHFCPLADCSTLRQRALFRQRVERDYKPQLGAKAMGIYGSIWRCSGNTTFKAIIGLERLMEDNGIKSKGGIYPHLRRLEAAGLIEIRNRTTPFGSQLAKEYILLDPYIPRLLDLSNHNVFLLNGGSKNDPILGINSPPLREEELIYLDLEDFEREDAMSAPQSNPPLLSQAAEADCTGDAITPVVEDEQAEPKPMTNESSQEMVGNTQLKLVRHEAEQLSTRLANITVEEAETYYNSLSKPEQDRLSAKIRGELATQWGAPEEFVAKVSVMMELAKQMDDYLGA